MRLALALAALIAATGPASAGLSVCNNSVNVVGVALGQFDGKRWTSQGWWRVEPKRCNELVTANLVARYYYLYATDGAFSTWDGDKSFCANVLGGFSGVTRRACEARGYSRLGFFEVDTGNQLNWTYSLSNPR